MDVLLFYFEFVYFWSCWVFAAQALLQLCRAETPGAVLGGSLGVLPSCGRGWRGAALLWGRASQGAPLLWGGASQGASLVGGAYQGAALLWAGLAGATLLWAGLLGCCPLVGGPSRGAALLQGGAGGGAGFSSFCREPHRCGFRSLERRLSIWDAQA